MSPDPILPGLFLPCSPPLPLGSSSGRWFESCSCKPVRGAVPHQPYSYAKSTNRLRCSVLLMTQLEKELKPELDGPARAFLVRDRTKCGAAWGRIRVYEHHVIHGIDGLGAELERLGLRNPGVF